MSKHHKHRPLLDVPDSIVERLRGAEKGKVAEEGIKFALEQIEEFKEMEGVAGIHLMAIEWEHRVPEIAKRANVLPRPEVWFRQTENSLEVISKIEKWFEIKDGAES